jgi:hypothetical protein
MSFPLDVHIDQAAINRIRASMADQPQIMDAALVRAINRTASFIMTNIARDASAATGIQQRLIRKRLFAKRATRGQLEAMIWLGIVPFRASALMGRELTRDDVRKYRNRRITVRGMQLPANSFVQKIFGNSYDIYARTGRSRFPVQRQVLEVQSPFVSVANDVSERAREIFFSTLDHEIAYRTGQLG